MPAPDENYLERFFAYQPRLEAFVNRFLPPGFRSAHDVCYPCENVPFDPAAAQLDELLAAYADLLTEIQPRPNDYPAYAVLACMEMMDVNELVLGYLKHAEPAAVPVHPELRPLLDASLRNLQTVFDGREHDCDSGKRYYSLRAMLFPS